MVDTVNIVGSGGLGREFDLEQLASNLELPCIRYDPETYPGLYLRFSEGAPLITIFRTGKYNISGASSIEILEGANCQLLEYFADLHIIDSDHNPSFSVQNMVCIGNIGFELDLNAVAIGLGLEYVEYEPEQFPGLVYRTESGPVCILFGSGKVVITGIKEKQVAIGAFAKLKSQLKSLLS